MARHPGPRSGGAAVEHCPPQQHRAVLASCIDTVEDIDPQYNRYRVCAVGTPGIGKTFTTPLLLRILLLKKPPSTVVYIRRSAEGGSWFYEFVSTSEGGLRLL